MSTTARDFLRLANWCEWQEEASGAGWPVHQFYKSGDAWAKLKRDAAFIIGYGCSGELPW